MDRQKDKVSAEFESNWRSRRSGPTEDPESQAQSSRNPLSIAIAATFTAKPLEFPLKFWMKMLGVVADIEFAPYAQVMQELLDPRSLLSQTKVGFNIVLIRPEDWIRDRLASESLESNLKQLRDVTDEFVAALGTLRKRTQIPIFVVVCPFSSFVPPAYVQPLERSQDELGKRLGTLQNVHCWTHTELCRLYPVSVCEDPEAERIGHIPYTDEYFVAIATLLARGIASLVKPPFKVIAVDCDNTLWKGICGEDGAEGIELTPAHLHFQGMLIRQHDAGMLICVCSKNNAVDVEAVFRRRSDMVLREEHVVSWRVNWNPKSASLQSLSEELALSPDSFIFIDDSPVECAEVQVNCPSVLTLQFPQALPAIRHFIDHIWAFDHLDATTEEGKRRTAQYKENRARKSALERTENLDGFLASLELMVDVTPLQPGQLRRVAELVQRTNQFNLTTVRRQQAEIEVLWRSGEIQILVVDVKDRFGAYGLVGALFLREENSSLNVDTFILSCRVLGRGVEHRIINELGRMAREDSLSYIVLSYGHTPRNQPAWEFLERSFGQFRSSSKDNGDVVQEAVFSIPVDYAERVAISGTAAKSLEEECKPTTGSKPGRSGWSTRWHEEAYRLSHLPDIVREMARCFPIEQHDRAEYVAPRNPIEAAVAGIWAEVLGIEAVGMRDDFFRLGGDSVHAVRAVARVASGLGLELPLDQFFEEPTVEKIAAKLAGASRVEVPILHTDRPERTPLSWAQQRVWFIDQLEGNSTAYHIPVAVRLKGELNRLALQAALDGLVRRHDALRTVFNRIDGEAVQVIAPHISVAPHMLDLRALGPAEREAEVRRQVTEEVAAPFDLSAGPLVRCKLLRLSADEHFLMLTMHHMVSDGWSIGLAIRELAALYRAHVEGQPDPLPPLSVQYADYAYWQRQLTGGAELEEQLAYWKEHLGGAPELLELPTDRPRPVVRSYQGASVPVSLGSDLTAGLRALSRQLNLTLAMTLFTAWSVVLARLSGQEDVVLGMPVANRRRTELEGLIGFFANTVAVRVRLGDDPLVSDLLQQVKRSLVGAYAHQDVPFEQVVEALRPARSLSHNPVFQVMFVLQNPPFGVLQLPGLRLSEEQVPLHTAQFDLLLSLQDSHEAITGIVNYATDLFDAATIDRSLGCFTTVLTAMVQQRQLRVSRLPLTSENELHQLIQVFNDTVAPFPRDKLVHELFEEQVERTPGAVAVMYEGQSLTYAELNRKANRLARCLTDRGVRPDQLVGICVERSPEMVIGLLGILKAAGAYVPLDPTYPPERLAYILEDAAPRVVVIQNRLRRTLPPTAAEFIVLDGEYGESDGRREENLGQCSQHVDSRHLAYVLYTSGSTGRPKGVMVEHSAVVNFLASMQRSPGITAADRLLSVTTISFDIAALEIYLPLISGATLVVASQQAASDARTLMAMMEEMDVTILQGTPATWQLLLSGGWNGRSNLKGLCGGEALMRALSEKVANRVAALWNLYGPTETTIWSCGRQVAELPDQQMTVESIGRPIANTQVYILDQWYQPVPIGIPGELYIGGAGVARGYWGRPELTAERFIDDPFSGEPGARLYQTGDVGRWRSDGMIEYLGRNDHQVKIRGFRIELGEIEAQLVRDAKVEEAVVIAREDVPGDNRLVAYVIPDASSDEERALRVETLRTHLKSVLPEYMVPSAFVLLDRMPLTPNGKLDRRALPAPELGSYVSREYEPPQGEREDIVARIWRELLSLERAGRHDNFFELGGHSLLIVQMVERLRQVGLRAEVRRVFENPTLAALASTLTSESIERSAVPPNRIPLGCETITPSMLPLVDLTPEHIEQIVRTVAGGAANIQDIYPLAPLQAGILFHYLSRKHWGDTYARPLLLSFSSREHVNALVAALQAVIDRHDVLRTAVLWEHLPEPVQVVYRRALLPVGEIALNRERDALEQLEERMRPQQQRMNLQQAPLMRLDVCAESIDGTWFALLQTHHLILDNESLEIVLAEVMAHFTGQAHELPEPQPYRDHVAQVLAQAHVVDAEAFFRRKLSVIDEPTAPFGLVDVHGDGSQNALSNEELDLGLARELRAQARRLGVSAATLFHVAWGLVVGYTSGRNDAVFGSVLMGRLQGSAGAQRIVGMFINTLPLRLRLSGVTVKELVHQTQRELAELLSHEQTSLAVAQRCSGMVGSMPLFSALLNYRHRVPNSRAEWSGSHGMSLLASQGWTNYPLVLSVDEMEEGYGLEMQTDRRIDPHRMIGYVTTAIRSLVTALAVAPQTPALELAILPERERHDVIERFNATRAVYPREKLIHQLFEEQMGRTPDATAVICDDRSLTYAELNAKANQLARYLRTQGVEPDQLVGVCVERGIELVVGLLGILKAGGAYVPLDPTYPAERLRYMLQDSAPRVLLTQKRLRGILPSSAAKVIVLDDDSEEIARQGVDNPDTRSHQLGSHQLAYVIYTSGSTGKPKGVMIEHRSLVNLATWHCGAFDLSAGDRCSSIAATGFDASGWEIWPSLTIGAAIVLASPTVTADPPALMEWWERQDLDVSFLPTPIAELIFKRSAAKTRLRVMLVGGDRLRTRPPDSRYCLVNNYGPTESTVVATSGAIRAFDTVLHIGKPIANTQVYILDRNLRPVPIGVSGELFIGGEGVARGYWRRPDLTSERFLSDPYGAGPHSRMYRTGDICRWREDGTIEYQGRNDEQVKIRGFRIELGEIEAQLARHENVKAVVVMGGENVSGDMRLVAYIVPRHASWSDSTSGAEALYTHLKTVLPEYMLPGAFVMLDELPLTPNGKLDRRALPEPDLGAYVHRQYEAPEGEIEEALARIWQGVLSVERVGRQDNFFELGGHSLLALKLLLRANESLSSSLTIADIYKSPTVRELAARLRGAEAETEYVDLSKEAVLDSGICVRAGLRRFPHGALLLTGGTGFVGRFLIAQLLRTTDATVYCLVRARSQQHATSRLRETLLNWDLWSEEFEKRIRVVQGDLRQPCLGVSTAMYETLLREVDSIYHCATSMNHLETYAMAKPANVAGIGELLKLATHVRLKQVNYISTLSVFSPDESGVGRVVDEQSSIDFERHATSDGYSASKWVGEKMILTAGERGVPCNIFRLGIVWPDTQQGRYDELQTDYRVFQSSLISGCGIENYPYELPPTTVDYAARAIVFLASRHPNGREIFHISSSNKIVEGLFERCNAVAGTSLRLMPYYEWINEMKRLYQAGRSLPAVPLIEFAFSMDQQSFDDHQRRIELRRLSFDCTRTRRELEQARIVAPLDDNMLNVYLKNILSRLEVANNDELSRKSALG